MTESMKKPCNLRSRDWFDREGEPVTSALYLERYLNYGLTVDELKDGKPIVGIAQSGSDLAPCNRHHVELADRVKAGIRDAGGVPLEFPVHPIQETGRRPTAALDRNLQCISLIEILHGYPLDGVVLTTGCDKTTPAQLMAALSVDIPALALNVGPMLNGRYLGKCVGAGSVIWDARKRQANGDIDDAELLEMIVSSAPSAGHCNTMGTALTMNVLTEALGLMLCGGASIPAPYRDRQQAAYLTGRRIVEMIWEDLTPGKIVTRVAAKNAVVTCAAIGGSTNAVVHLNAIAAHAGIDLTLEDWNQFGADVPQIVNCRPTGEYLAEEFHQAGGAPAVMAELLKSGLLDGDALTASGENLATCVSNHQSKDSSVIRSINDPVRQRGGFIVLTSNFFESAIMKASAISESFFESFFATGVFESAVVVFDGPDDYHNRIDDPNLNITDKTILVMRGAGPVGHPGSAEVVNMRPPKRLLREGIDELPTMGDGRQSGTSAAPSILHVTPESAIGGGLALLETGDRIAIDLNKRLVTLQISDTEIEARRTTQRNSAPSPQTWWQATYQQQVSQLDEGGIFPDMLKYRSIKSKKLKDSH